MRKLLTFLTVLLIMGVTPLFAQNVTVKGIVKDAKTGEELIGVTVFDPISKNGVATGPFGDFSIVVPKGRDLTVTCIGYKDQHIRATSEEVTVLLEADAQFIEEVVVVGYGTQKVKDMTAPISSVKGGELSKQVASNPMSALQGKMSGVQVINSGAPGEGPSVKIRGVGSIGDYSNPLYIVDGVFVDNIDFLSSGDIDDLTVLKDASAAAIYGVRAANGVVLVTTRKGKIDQTSINFESYVGVQMPSNVMKLANREQYVELMNLANENTTGYVPKVVSNYPASTDWYSVLLRNALTHNHSLDFSGATEKSSYSVGINYYYQDGIMDAVNNFDRLNFRAKLDQKVNDYIMVGVNAVVSDYTKKNPNNNAFFSAFVNPPVYPVYDDNNSVAYPVKFGAPQQYAYGNHYGNPYATAYYNDNKEDGLKLVFSAFAELNLIKDKLKFKTSYNLDFGSSKMRNYTPEFHVGGSQGINKSNLSKSFYQSKKQIIDNLLTFAENKNDHRYTLMLGQSTRIEQYYDLTGYAHNVPGTDDASKYLKNGSFKERFVRDGGSVYHGLSFFTRGTYNYKDRYLATFTFRADGSSKYQHKWGFFPSVGIGWNMSNESFMKGNSKFELLKLRASWGMLGNDNVPANSAVILGLIGIGSSGVFGDKLVDGQGAQTVLQKYLNWEVVTEFNIGLDFSLLKNKLKGEIDYYNRVTDNAVFYAPIASGGGVAELLSNNGKILNHGVEFSLNWSDEINDHFNYHIGWNLTTIFNKVTRLDGRDFIPGASVRGN